MGIFDKILDTAAVIGDRAKEMSENAKAAYEEKKAQEEAHKEEMNALVESRRQKIINAIMEYENNGSFFQNTNKDELISFTKKFFDEIVLPASSVSNTKIKMIPYLDAKSGKKIKDKYGTFDPDEEILLYLSAEGKQEIVLSDRKLYFSLILPEDPKYFVDGCVGIENISMLSTDIEEGKCLFKCDEYILASFTADKVTLEDFVSLNKYFQSIYTHDFDITDEEVDQLIREKIGDNIVAQLSRQKSKIFIMN